MRSSPAPRAAEAMRPISQHDLVLAPISGQAPALPAPHARHDTCQQCDGAGWFLRPVALGHPDFGKLLACGCTERASASRRSAELVRLSNLTTFAGQTFATFDALVPGVQEAYLRAQDFARRPVGWLTLAGPYGCGKTHLAAAIGHVALAHGAPVLFAAVPDLLDHLRAAFRPESAVDYDARFELVRSVALLVLDDLGSESGTPWAREKLYQIINHRYVERLPTVITTNVRLDALDGRIASRLHDQGIGAAIVHLQAADYRRRGAAEREVR